MAYLTNKMIAETKTPEGKKKYTVKQLRSMVRAEIKNVNKIIADLSASDKDRYIQEYTRQVGNKYLNFDKTSGEFLIQTKVKYMSSKRLRSTYNALQAIQEASTSDVEFAERLKTKKQRALDDWNEDRSEEEQITMEEYEEMIDVFSEYDDLVEQYGYNEILDQIKRRKKDDDEPIWKKIKSAESDFDMMGFTKTKEKILTYVANKDAFIAARNKIIMDIVVDKGVTPQQAADMVTFEMVNEELSKQ